MSTSSNRFVKQELISSAYSRVTYAISKGFHIEAIAIIESLLADRLESAIHVSNPEIRIKSTLGALIKRASDMKLISAEFAEEIRNWHDARSKVIHEMVKLSEEIESTWKERMSFARLTAAQGVKLAKTLDKTVKKIKKESK